MMTRFQYRELDNSLVSFELIKRESEKYWESIELELYWGYQIQQGSRWKQGLTEQQLADFQQQVGIQFSESLKNYYRTMNGLDKPGLDTCGGEGEVEFGPTFYSYPEDVARIKDYIAWVSEDNHVAKEAANSLVPAVFPYYAHRFLILDEEEKVLSMRGSDIIFWAENLSKGIANDIFSFRSRVNSKKVNKNSFWNREALALEEIRKKSFLNRG